MASPAQVLANRQNAVKHGLSSGFTLLAGEDPAEFQALLDDVTADMQPSNNNEIFLVERMAQSRWKLARIQRFETEFLEKMLTGDSVEKQLGLMLRYSAAAERSYFKAYNQLVHERRAQLKQNSDALNQYIRKEIFAPPPGREPAAIAASPAAQPKPAARENGLGNSFRKTPAADLGNLALRL